MKEIRLRARAKINLTLDVTGKREDGYHTLEMLMQSVTLYDGVLLRRKKEGGIIVSSNRKWLPTDRRNLAWRAAELMLAEGNIQEGVEIVLDKRIPVAAGLAGGSADAAAVLVGMDRLFGLHFGREKLEEIGLRLGTDIPYCIRRGTVLATGVGEVLEDISPQCPRCFVVLAKPNVSVSTKTVYQNLDLQKLPYHPDTEAMLSAIATQDVEQIGKLLCNVLETVTIPMHPVIAQVKERFLEMGAAGTLMSGSGPTVFALFTKEEAAKSAAKKIQKEFGFRDVVLTGIFHVAQEKERSVWKKNSRSLPMSTFL